MTYLWLKLFHIYFIISWFAGLFYLPRIYVNLAQLDVHSAEYQRLTQMSLRLFRFMTPIGILALIFGLALMFTLYLWTGDGNKWAHGKILIGALLVAYHIWCGLILRDFMNHKNNSSHKWFRYFNEVPAIIMLVALYLVMFRPF